MSAQALPAGIKTFRFSGTAGQYQDARALGALVRELGTHYAKYHLEVAAAYQRAGPPPSPDAYLDDLDGYAAAWTSVQDLVVAEALLRRAYAFCTLGIPLTTNRILGPPILDERRELTAVAVAPSSNATEGSAS
jgi:hypothetical protein